MPTINTRPSWRALLGSLLFTLWTGSPALAAPDRCEPPVFYGKPPVSKAKGSTWCYPEFAAFVPGNEKFPRWVAYTRTTSKIQGAARVAQVPLTPKEERRAPYATRATAQAYTGHALAYLAPLDAMSSDRAREDAAIYTNAVPVPAAALPAWEAINAKLRTAAEKESLFVISGPLYSGGDTKPSHLFAAALSQVSLNTAAYVVSVTNPTEVRRVTLEVLEQAAGLNIFPHLKIIRANPHVLK